MTEGFDDILFPGRIALQMDVAAMYRNTVHEDGGGMETVWKEWSQPRFRWSVSAQFWDQDLIEDLLNFWHARSGNAYGFRIRCFAECTAGMRFGEDGWTTEGAIPEPLGIGDGDRAAWPLTKRRGDALRSVLIDITRPVADSFKAYLRPEGEGEWEEVPGEDWLLDDKKGILTFLEAPAEGSEVAWSGMFDFPARFETDEMMLSYEALMAGAWRNLTIISIKERE